MTEHRIELAASLRVAWHVASHEAIRAGSTALEPIHLFFAILNMIDDVVDPLHRAAVTAALDEEPTIAEDIQMLLGVADAEDLTRIRRAIQRSLPRLDVVTEGSRTNRRSQRCRDVFNLAGIRAVRDGSAALSLIHVIGALVEAPPGDVAPFLPSRDSEKPALLWESRVNDFADEFRLTRITLLMTDIEGSMAIKRRFGDLESARIFRAHDNLFRDELRLTRGREIKTIGDAFLLAFPEEAEAVEFALRIQLRLRTHVTLSSIPIRVRIGIHAGSLLARTTVGSGRSDPIFGIAIDTTSRITALAAGNQILMDGDVYECATRKLIITPPDGVGEVDGRDHGTYLMKGLSKPLRIFELGERDKTPFMRPAAGEKATQVTDESRET